MNTTSLKCLVDEIASKTANRTWVQRASFGESNANRVATTQKLLDGAIVAAKSSISSSIKPPTLTRSRWVWRLAGSYHLCHSTPRLMKEAAQNFAGEKHWSLAQWAAHKACEERDHDRLALLDLQSMGYDADAVVKTLVPTAAMALVTYFTQSANASDPIDCVGYSYTMERLAAGIGEQYIQKVETLLPPGINATRCLRVHSSVGADAEHVEETVEMVASLADEERIRIANACYQTALLCFSPPQGGYISSKKLQHLLKPLKLRGDRATI